MLDVDLHLDDVDLHLDDVDANQPMTIAFGKLKSVESVPSYREIMHWPSTRYGSKESTTIAFGKLKSVESVPLYREITHWPSTRCGSKESTLDVDLHLDDGEIPNWPLMRCGSFDSKRTISFDTFEEKSAEHANQPKTIAFGKLTSMESVASYGEIPHWPSTRCGSFDCAFDVDDSGPVPRVEAQPPSVLAPPDGFVCLYADILAESRRALFAQEDEKPMKIQHEAALGSSQATHYPHWPVMQEKTPQQMEPSSPSAQIAKKAQQTVPQRGCPHEGWKDSKGRQIQMLENSSHWRAGDVFTIICLVKKGTSLKLRRDFVTSDTGKTSIMVDPELWGKQWQFGEWECHKELEKVF
jgi:hypothetical protein